MGQVLLYLARVHVNPQYFYPFDSTLEYKGMQCFHFFYHASYLNTIVFGKVTVGCLKVGSAFAIWNCWKSGGAEAVEGSRGFSSLRCQCGALVHRLKRSLLRSNGSSSLLHPPDVGASCTVWGCCAGSWLKKWDTSYSKSKEASDGLFNHPISMHYKPIREMHILPFPRP